MTATLKNNTTFERLSSLETSVNSLTVDVQHIARAVDALRDSMVTSQRPQWGNLIGGVAVSITIIMAVGSASLAPLAVELRQHATVLEERGRIIGNNQDRLRELEGTQLASSKVVDVELKALATLINDMRVNGSGITRERLAVIESKLDEHLPSGKTK